MLCVTNRLKYLKYDKNTLHIVYATELMCSLLICNYKYLGLYSL